MNRVRTLLVEDDHGDVRLLQETVRAGRTLELDLTVARDLAEAREALDSNAYDLVLVDLSLPGSDGMDTFRSVADRVGDAALIVLTGTADQDLAHAAVRQGAQDYLLKGEHTPRELTRCLLYALERRAAEQRRLDLERELSASRWLQSIGRAATTVAHEVRNPLHVLRHCHRRLVAGLAGVHDADTLRQLARMGDALRRADRVVEGLLDFGRPPKLDQADHDVRALVEAAVDATSLHARLAPEDVEVVVAPECGRVRCDADRILQVLVNLIENALAQLGPGDGLALRVGVQDGHVRFEVIDDGPGLPEGADVFEPFFSARPDGSGTGLGLAVSRGLVEQHGGRLSVSDREDARGAVARLELPVSTRVLRG